MTVRRRVVLATGLVMAAAATAFAIVGWSRMEALSAALTVLIGIAALGVSVWAGIRPSGAATVRVTGTGSVRGHSGLGVTGVDSSATLDRVVVEQTGDVDGGGDAVTGYRQG